ncbi:MAG: hypothetical protein JWN65_3165 [Solirubrobacterales bacterium]|nr:hypothetical protein [Solirubrobacterales bacterium]
MHRLVTLLAAVSAGLAAVSLGACGDSGQDSRVARPVNGDQSTSPTGADFHHVHGIGVNPKDGALFIATHSGLFRAPRGGTSARRVGDSRQDVMGFTVVGPDRFLGSGYPDPGAGGQVSASNDGGRRWAKRGSIGGRPAAFASDRQELYAAHADGTVVRSSDGGMSWAVRARPAS